MSEEDLELLITLDDPEGAPEEDTFNHFPVMSCAPSSRPRRSEAALSRGLRRRRAPRPFDPDNDLRLDSNAADY